MSATDSTTLRLERTYDAKPEEVFDAWTNPEVLRRWWMVDEARSTPEADVDLRVGGSYRLSMENPGADSRLTVRGVYREVARPERLVYTWAWEEEDGSTGHESTVTVSFVGAGERTWWWSTRVCLIRPRANATAMGGRRACGSWARACSTASHSRPELSRAGRGLKRRTTNDLKTNEHEKEMHSADG